MRISDISPENRPRQRLERHGASVLSDAELLAVVLNTGNGKENVIDVSNRLISRYGAGKLAGCSLKELQEVKGIGRVKASQIVAFLEFNKRQGAARQDGLRIRCAEDVFNYVLPKTSCLDRERFMVLHLDTKNRVIKEEVVSIGTLNSSLIHPRELFRSAIRESANALILVHNHPSGDPSPSKEDEKITERLFEAGELLNIKVLDHVIAGAEGYYSFRDGG